MYAIAKEFSKTIKGLLTGKEAKNVGNYKIPQFGEKLTEGMKHDDTAAALAFQEALAYFGADGFVQHLNWSLGAAAQRHANNALRSSTAGLSPADQARVALIVNLAKRSAESEAATFENGTATVDRKSIDYKEAFVASIRRSLEKPKFADLAPAFDVSDGVTADYDLTIPGSLGGDVSEDSDEE